MAARGALEADARVCRICRSRSRPTVTGRPGWPTKYTASLRRLQCVNGRPSFSGRVVAATTISSTSWSLIRRGRPPAHRGSSTARPLALNKWITSRPVSSSAATSRAIALTGVPRRRHDDHCPAHPGPTHASRAARSAAAAGLPIGQPPGPHLLGHHALPALDSTTTRSSAGETVKLGQPTR
jgi:hypothetical protein